MAFSTHSFLAIMSKGPAHNRYNDALNAFFTRSSIPKNAMKTLKKRGCGKEDAEEIIQDATVTLVKQIYLGQYKHQGKLSSYFTGICINIHKNKLRKNNNVKHSSTAPLVPFDSVSPFLEGENISLVIDDEERKYLTSLILDQLDNKCQVCLELFYLKSYTIEQIASELDYANYNSAKTGLHKCMLKLRSIIAQRPLIIQRINNIL